MGIEATGSMQWFVNLMEELGIECLVGHPAEIRAAEPQKQKHEAFSSAQFGSLANLSRWAFLLTFAGVGLRTNIADMRKQGLRPFLVGAVGEIAIAGLTLGLVLGASRFIH
jgi:Conserved hypothetical protein 698